MEVTLLTHSKLSEQAKALLGDKINEYKVTDAQVASLACIRQCYSHKTAFEVLDTEFDKYFGEKGQEGKRLMNHIVKSGHTSTLESCHFSFTVEGVSRALLAQLTRHRQLSFSVQSQRYNKFSSDSRSGGFGYVTPKTVEEDTKVGDGYHEPAMRDLFRGYMEQIQSMYDEMIHLGIPQEDARAVLPNAATCNLVTSGNLRAWLEFYSKRKKGNGAQAEIAEFAERIKDAIVAVEPWTKDYFEMES